MEVLGGKLASRDGPFLSCSDGGGGPPGMRGWPAMSGLSMLNIMPSW